MDCSSPVGLICPWDSPGKYTEVGWHMLFTRGSSSPSNQTCNSTSPSLAGGFFITTSAIWEALKRIDIRWWILEFTLWHYAFGQQYFLDTFKLVKRVDLVLSVFTTVKKTNFFKKEIHKSDTKTNRHTKKLHLHW